MESNRCFSASTFSSVLDDLSFSASATERRHPVGRARPLPESGRPLRQGHDGIPHSLWLQEAQSASERIESREAILS